MSVAVGANDVSSMLLPPLRLRLPNQDRGPAKEKLLECREGKRLSWWITSNRAAPRFRLAILDLARKERVAPKPVERLHQARRARRRHP
jgi:hypothetical protein